MVAVMGTACRTKKAATTTSSPMNRVYMGRVYTDLQKNLRDARVVRSGDTVKVIYPELAMFDFNKDVIKPEALPSFLRFARILKEYDRVRFFIDGYTDNVGTTEVNNDLSRRRAESARSFMEQNGILSSRMRIHAHGFENPIMSNETAEGRQANRRVEFVLLYDYQFMD